MRQYKTNTTNKDNNKPDLKGIPNYATSVYLSAQNSSIKFSSKLNASKLNAFLLKKTIDNIYDIVQSASFCKSASVLMENVDINQVRALLKTKHFLNGTLPIKAELASRLDTIKGIIYASSLFNVSENIVSSLGISKCLEV